jgi:hypothetical protein
LRGLCCAVLQIFTPHRTVHSITFAGPSSHNLSCMSSSSLRPEPAVVEAPLLQSAYYESACVLMNSASRLHFVQRCDAPAMRCGCNAMRRCDGDATAMRRRCDHANGDATAQKPARKPAQKPAQYHSWHQAPLREPSCSPHHEMRLQLDSEVHN